MLNTFSLFPLLPTELRLKIWEHSIPQSPALLPRTDTADACRSACRESRAVHMKAFTPLFTPAAKLLFDRPISPYANLRLDNTLYVDDVEILRMDLKDWIIPEVKYAIRHLALNDEIWLLRGPTRGEAVLEARGDARFMMLHPGNGLNGLEVVTLVQAGMDATVLNSKRKEFDKRRLVACGEFFEEDKGIVGDVRHVFATLNSLNRLGLYAGWKEPELRFAVISYE